MGVTVEVGAVASTVGLAVSVGGGGSASSDAHAATPVSTSAAANAPMIRLRTDFLSKARSRWATSAAYSTASGFTGEPVPPRITSGAQTNWNS